MVDRIDRLAERAKDEAKQLIEVIEEIAGGGEIGDCPWLRLRRHGRRAMQAVAKLALFLRKVGEPRQAWRKRVAEGLRDCRLED